MGSITAMLDDLAAGRAGIEQVAAAFGKRSWPAGNVTSTTPSEAFQRLGEDPDPFTEGSWDEVSAAYSDGTITSEQYNRLYEAVNGR